MNYKILGLIIFILTLFLGIITIGYLSTLVIFSANYYAVIGLLIILFFFGMATYLLGILVEKIKHELQ